MSIISCLAKMQARGEISEEQRKQAEAVYNGAWERLYPTMGPAADARAAIEAAEAMEKYAKEERVRLAQNKLATNAARERINNHPNGPMAGVNSIISHDIHSQPGENIDGLSESFLQRGSQFLNQLIDKYGTQMGGLKGGVANMDNLLREMRGVSTGDQTAGAIAKAWKDLTGPDGEFIKQAKMLGRRFTPAEDWGAPQFWETYRARQFKTPELMSDWRKWNGKGLQIFDPETHAIASPLKVESIMASAADKITKDLPWEGGVGGAFAHDMRVFRFTQDEAGANAYKALMDKYGPGKGGYVGMLQGHIRRLSRDLGAMKLLGPDWQTNLEGLYKEAVEKNRDGKWDQPDPAWSVGGQFQKAGEWTMNRMETEAATGKMVDYITGKSSRIQGQLTHDLFNGYRGFTTARKMGSGVVTATFQDPVNMFMEASWLGLNKTRMFGDLAKFMLLPKQMAGDWTDGELTRMGIVLKNSTDEGIGVKRFEDQWLGSSLGSRLGNFVVRASRLNRWDEIMRTTFQKEFLGAFGDRAGKSWDELDAPFKDHLLKTYGFTPEEWKTLSDPANHFSMGKARFLDTDKLHGVNEDLRQKLISAMANERTFAYVVGGSSYGRALVSHAVGKPGTLGGELWRGAFQFKTWPVTYLTTWGARAMTQPGIQAKIPILARMLIFGTMGGAMTLQAKSMLNGKTMQDMENFPFWLSAMAQGEVAGLASQATTDFLAKDAKTMMETIGGPMVSDYNDIHDVVAGGARDAVLGEKENWGAALARSFRDAVPGGTVWYAKLMFQRMIVDEFQKLVDSKYAQSWRNQERRLQKQTGQRYTVPPGSMTQ